MPWPVFAIPCTIVGAILIYHLLKRNDEDRQRTNREEVRFGIPYNNHDDQKFKHSNRYSAEAEVRRMKRRRYPGSERLQVYYNRELKGWFVGRSKYGYEY